MKMFFALILSCASVLGADTNVQVTTTTRTGGVRDAGIYRTDVFTRAGHKDLVCNTFTPNDGKGTMLTQSFYHDSLLVGTSIMAGPQVQNFVTEAGSPYSVQFTFSPSKKTGFIYITAKDGEILDGFTCTNGIFYPADSHLIAEENKKINLGHFLIAH